MKHWVVSFGEEAGVDIVYIAVYLHRWYKYIPYIFSYWVLSKIARLLGKIKFPKFILNREIKRRGVSSTIRYFFGESVLGPLYMVHVFNPLHRIIRKLLNEGHKNPVVRLKMPLSELKKVAKVNGVFDGWVKLFCH